MAHTEIPNQTDNHRTLRTALEEIFATLQTGSGAPHHYLPRDNESDDDDWHRSEKKKKFSSYPRGLTSAQQPIQTEC